MVGRRSAWVARGTGGLGSVGPLLAVLMSMQQGRGGVRSRGEVRIVGHFAGYRRRPQTFQALPGGARRAGPGHAAAKFRTGHRRLPVLVPRAGAKISELLTRQKPVSETALI